MELSKNTDLFNAICLVQIKSVTDIVDIPDLQTIYHTPSKISFTINSSPNESGVLHRKRLTLNYPGLSTADFNKFHKLLHGEYQVFIKLDNNDIYEVASITQPLELASTYNQHHSLVFSGSSPIPVKYRDNQPGTGIEIDGFNYDFNFYLS
ncbi:hypothetical protein [Winogradskyella pulchriflava]|uniref:Uncharacterized protein n=1 Tax=Winogradskyella pulchriflava TaxID=1110688 RepID=A0ABV6QC79_9FLAO